MAMRFPTQSAAATASATTDAAFERAGRVADAVLYEGYVLYPYPRVLGAVGGVPRREPQATLHGDASALLEVVGAGDAEAVEGDDGHPVSVAGVCLVSWIGAESPDDVHGGHCWFPSVGALLHAPEEPGSKESGQGARQRARKWNEVEPHEPGRTLWLWHANGTPGSSSSPQPREAVEKSASDLHNFRARGGSRTHDLTLTRRLL